MLNLSDELARFIELIFKDNRLEVVLESFSIFEKFSLPNYEDKYTDIIYRQDSIDIVVRNQMFTDLLEKDLTNIISQHGVTISTDFPASIEELVEVCSMLLLIPNLEDLTAIRYRVLSEEIPKVIFSQLLERYTSIGILRSMEMVEDVSEGLLESIKDLCGSECEDTRIVIDRNHRSYVEKFFTFIERSPCLGLQLYEDGYGVKLTVEELINLLKFSMDSHIDKLLITNPAQAALDVLSILIITKEEYEIPLTKFKVHAELFTTDLTQITRLSHMILGIMNDFGVYLEATRQQENLDEQNNN